jgi:hypothetical protein
MNDEQKRIQKQAAVAKIEVLFNHLPESTVE